MMGEHSGKQDRLFYSFNLDEHVPADHLLRGIDRFLDLADLRHHLPPFYSHTGRPSVDPELMVRMLLVGYCFGIRSERRLCEEVHLNLAYRWFCRLGLEDKVPDHSSFSKNRHGRFRESDVFRHVFEGVVRRCMAEGLVRGEGFAIDASVVKADANRQRGVPSQRVSTEQPGTQHACGPRVSARAGARRPGGRGTDEHLAHRSGSALDRSSRRTGVLCVLDQLLIDVRAGVIVDVEATAAHRTEETDATKTMIDRVEERFDLKPKRLIGDTAYGSAAMLGWLVDKKQIEPHIPVWDKTQRADDSLSSSAFQWHEQRNEYRCPQGYALRSEWPRSPQRAPTLPRPTPSSTVLGNPTARHVR